MVASEPHPLSRFPHVILSRGRRILPRWSAWAWDAMAVGLAFLLLYFLTLAPDVVGHDAGEFQFVPYIFGIPHYTGYPLYLVLGKL